MTMRKNLNRQPSPLAALLAFFTICFLATCASAQTNRPAVKTNAPAANGNRFLFIVDTSEAMKKNTDDTLRTIAEIIHSSASGQMHRGDTVGLWTFNKELFAGFLPLQTWLPDDANEVNLRTQEFLRQQRYGSESRLDKALGGMFTVIKNSDIITIFIISNGNGRMQGTPFDEEINGLYVESIKEMKKDRQVIYNSKYKP